MLQNKLLFNQSSVSLEIVGLPDYSNNENKDQISIISQWKLMIIDKPLIEGKIEHLSSIMNAFYIYSNLLINDDRPVFESKLIDIKADNFYTHNLVLKSSKPDVEPLSFKIGNSLLSDIINCFDQLNESPKVRKINSVDFNNFSKKFRFGFVRKNKLSNFLLPPVLSICSLFLASSTFIYFYNPVQENDNSSSIYLKRINSIQTLNTIV